MSANETLRVVLAGCGGMSAVWLDTARRIDGLEIVGLVDVREDAARRRAEESGLKDALLGVDLGKVLDAVSPEIVFDCAVPEAHMPVTLTALAHGCHVLGEKPLADSMETARQMIDAARKAARLCAVTQNRRYHPQVRRLQQLAASGRLGPLTTVNTDFYIGAHFGGFRDHMEHVLLLDMAIHTFDAARCITGTDPVAVTCREWNPPGSWYDHDASAVAIFEMTGGLVYTYRGSWCAEGLNTSWESQWRLIGRKGSATWDGAEGVEAQVVTGPGGFQSELGALDVPDFEDPEGLGGHEGVMRDFVRCIRTGGTPETDAADNIKSLAMVFGAIESAKVGKRVEITW